MATSENKLLDKNKIFFGLIHYILSEQKNVNWLIKSSLIDLTGISSVLEEKPYKKDSILDDVIDYVTSIKPYHVQFSHYFEHYQTASETVSIPSNDWIEPTINLRFDSLQSIPDINKLFYNVVDTLPVEPTEPDPEDYETEEEYEAALQRYIIALETFINTYNNTNLTIFNTFDKAFYVRSYNSTTYVWSWVKSDEPLTSDGFYCTTNPKNLYKVITENNKDTLKKFSSNEIINFIDSHRANRLFYIKYYDTNTKMWKDGGITSFDEIKKELNANFKGIEINGSVFDIEKFGYDIFNYDTTDYDSPTIIYDYYFVEKYDNNFKQTGPYFILDSNFDYTSENYFKKYFVSSTEHRFSINGGLNIPPGYELAVYKVSPNGIISKYEDYECPTPYTYIDVFTGLLNKEKIYLTIKKLGDETIEPRPEILFAYVIEASSFSESNSDVLRRSFIKYDISDISYDLQVPSTALSSADKIAIQKRDGTTDARNVFTNYEYNDGNITIYNATSGIHVGDHIIMTSFDYKYLYDKIYTWEDRYGRSNNIVNLDGKTFLRARYEEDRPSEKVVSYPLNTLFLKHTNNDIEYTIYFNDYKNQTKYSTILDDVGATLYKEPSVDENGMITSLYIDKINNIEVPQGKILINSEIIEYKSVIEHTENNKKYWELTRLNRGLYGSTLYSNLLPKYYPNKTTHSVGDKLIPFNDDEWYDKEKNNIYKCYNVYGNNAYTYKCPTGTKLTSDLELSKLPKINLLKDVNEFSTEILIDSCNVVSGWYKLDTNGNPEPLQTTLKNDTLRTVYRGDFSLKIDNDVVPFKSIYKDTELDNTYHICDITLPEKYIGYKYTTIYSKDNSIVYSCIPENISSYFISYIEGDFTYEIMQKKYKGTVSTYNNLPTSGQVKYDVYHVTNTNKNYYWNGAKWVEDDTTVDYQKYVLLNDNTKLYRIEKDTIFEIGTKLTQETEGTDPQESEFTYSERLFGYIVDNMVTKTDGSIYAKIEDNKFISIQTIVTIDENLQKGESIHINVIN